MTIQEQIERSRKISQYIMQTAVPMGLWFIVEYLLTALAMKNVALTFIRTPMMLLTPVLLFIALRRLRNIYFSDDEFGRFRCWYYGVQLMFFGSLIEAVGIAVFNQWIVPSNLAEMHSAMLSQYQQVIEMLQNSNSGAPLGSLTDTLTQMKTQIEDMPVETPVGAAVNMLSNDILYGILWALPFSFLLHRKPSADKNEKNK